VTRIAWIYLLTVAGIAFAAIFVRLALPAPPIITGFYRMLFASLALGVWFGVRRQRIQVTGRAALFAVAAGVCFGFDLAFWHISILGTSVALATLLVNLTPIHVGLYAVLVRRERLGARFTSGAALALCGSAVLLGDPGGAAGGLRGAGFAIIASLFYAGYLLWMSEARRKIDTLSALFLMTATATAVLGAAGLALGDPFHGFPASAWAAMLGVALISQLGGVMGVVWLLRHLPAHVASVALLAQPVAAAGLAWLLLGEPLGALEMLGGVVVLAGIGLAASAPRAPAPPQPA
jgi:drug/metabolite transporter (DMT)-like permease